MKDTSIVQLPTIRKAPIEGKLLNIATVSPSKGVDMTRVMIMASLRDSLVVARVHKGFPLNLCGSRHHLFWNLMFAQLFISFSL